jgi:hypothetical protein
MSGQPAGEDAAGGPAAEVEDAAEPEEPAAPAPRRKGQRMRRFEEIMSGRPIQDPEADPEETPSSADRQ